MLELKAAPFYLAVAELAEISAWIAAGKSQVRGSISEAENLLPPDKAFLVPKLATLRFQLATLGAPVTALALEEAQQAISGAFQPPMTWGAARTRIEDVRTTLRRELSRLTLLVLEPREQEFYAPAQPLFGPDVAAKFPTQAAFEIDEAAKCLALDRSTGAVFHLMRVMEVGIRAVARSWRDGDSQVR